MKLKYIAPAIVGALLLAMPAMASYPPDQVISLKGNYIITGDLYVDGLLSSIGSCLEVGTQGQIIATGSACGGGGGGVISVTAGPSGNITAAPNTGAVIVDEIEDPTFTGAVSAASLTATGLTPGDCVQAGVGGLLTTTGSACGGGGGGVASVTAGPSGNQTFSPNTGAVIGDIVENPTFTGVVTDTPASHSFTWQDIFADPIYIDSDGSTQTAFISNSIFGIHSGANRLAVDASGNLGIQGVFHSVPLEASAGDCLEAGTDGHGGIQSTGSPCGGGGGAVSSVTSIDTNIVASPTTGAVQLSLSSHPIFSGLVGVGSLISSGTIQGSILGATNLIGAGGDCLEANGGEMIVSTGSPCATGGVTSVTAGPSGNITAAPTTGAVIVDEIEDPTFTGTITGSGNPQSAHLVGITTIGNPGTYGDNNTMTQAIEIANGTGIGGDFATILSANNPVNAVSGVQGQLWTLSDGNGTNSQMAVDPAGDLGVYGYIAAGSLAGSVGQGLSAGTNGKIVATGFPATVTQVAQVTASATSPWEATVTFATPFNTTPLCTTSAFSATPVATVGTIVSESTTTAVIYDASQTGATFNVSCTGS
jgi:hypothetical protein